jgi:hypothetical protein
MVRRRGAAPAPPQVPPRGGGTLHVRHHGISPPKVTAVSDRASQNSSFAHALIGRHNRGEKGFRVVLVPMSPRPAGGPEGGYACACASSSYDVPPPRGGT